MPKPKNKIPEYPEQVPITIKPDPKPDTPIYYVNYASITHSEFDFIMAVLRIPHQLSPEQTHLAVSRKPIPVEPLLQLVFPPRLIDGLIRALTTQKEKYEKEHGPIRQRQDSQTKPN